MRQQARVIELLPGGQALVEVVRLSACGHNCSACGACAHAASHKRVTARNPVGASPGEAVWLESATGMFLGMTAVVYITPSMLFVLGLAAYGPMAGLAGLLAGLALAVFAGRRFGSRITFTIAARLSLPE